jgi:hypothetical protein
VIDASMCNYNIDRPHPSIGFCSPAERFAAQTSDSALPLDLTALSPRRDGDDRISRRVASNGFVCRLVTGHCGQTRPR